VNASRLFVGVPLEADALGWADALGARLRAACTEAHWKASWVPPRNMHLTLQFLGEVDPARTDALGAALAPLGARPALTLGLGGLGAFPSVERPSVLWVGARTGVAELTELATAVAGALEPLGFAPEARPFHPHLTLARVRRAGSALGPLFATLEQGGPAGCQSRATEIVLYRSERQSDGNHYEPIRRVPLAQSLTPSDDARHI